MTDYAAAVHARTELLVLRHLLPNVPTSVCPPHSNSFFSAFSTGDFVSVEVASTVRFLRQLDGDWLRLANFQNLDDILLSDPFFYVERHYLDALLPLEKIFGTYCDFNDTFYNFFTVLGWAYRRGKLSFTREPSSFFIFDDSY